MDVEVGISGRPGVVEAALVLRRRRPGRVGRRRGDHHEERLEVGLVLEEVQRHVGLRSRRTTDGVNAGRSARTSHFLRSTSHQNVGQVIFAVVGAVFQRLPVH